MKKIIFLLFLILLNFTVKSQTWHKTGCFKPNSAIYCLYVYNNDLITGMSWGPCDLSTLGIARFNGQDWLTTNGSTTIGIPRSFATYNNNLIIGGDFQSVNNLPNTSGVAVWNGDITWSQLSNFTIPNASITPVNALNYKNKLYAGGKFQTIGTTTYKYIASWNDTTWSSVGGGLTGGGTPSTGIYCMADYMGDLIVAGSFGRMGNTYANNIARWDGTTWHTLGGGIPNGVIATMFVDTINNYLYVGGNFESIEDTIQGKFIAKWDGDKMKWSALGNLTDNFHGLKSGVLSICNFNNKLYIGGAQSTGIASNDTVFAYWDNDEWTPIKGPYGNVNALAVYNGNLYVGGGFGSINGDTSIKYLACYGDSCPDVVSTHNELQVTDYELKVFPNPSDNKITIETLIPQGKNGEIRVYGISGDLKKEIALDLEKNSITLDVSKWKKGTYICNLYINKKLAKSEKMIVN